MTSTSLILAFHYGKTLNAKRYYIWLDLLSSFISFVESII